MPSLAQWAKLPAILSRKERLALACLGFLFISSLLFLLNGAYKNYTVEIPATAGSFTEGLVGSPRFLNPVYSEASDIDRALVQLVFSGLMKYGSQGNLVEDLAQRIQAQEDGKVYEVELKNNITWHDGREFSADDILFTIQTIQDPRYKSPVRANWIGVGVEKTGRLGIRFTLQEPFAAFPERLTQKILPRHIWENVGPENFALSSLNLRPIGTGPYRFSGITQDKSGTIKQIDLKANSRYAVNDTNNDAKSPNIRQISFRFFSNEQELIAEANLGKIQTFTLPSGMIPALRNPSLQTYSFSLPRYFGLFFQLDLANSPVQKKNVREALGLAISREDLVREVFNGNAAAIVSPVRSDLLSFGETPAVPAKNTDEALALFEKEGYHKENHKLVQTVPASGTFTSNLKTGSQSDEVRLLQQCLAQDPQIYPEGTINGVFGPATQKAVIAFQEKYAEEILAPSGLTKGTGAVLGSTREKLNKVCFALKDESPALELTITTLDLAPLPQVAEFLREEWAELGIQTNIEVLSSGELERDAIKPRTYEILLFGEILGKIPDPLPFWHSSQKKDPGLNLSAYANKTADKLLEQIRKESNREKRAELLRQLETVLLADSPAIILYDTPLIYIASKNIRGIQEQTIGEPSLRFAGIEQWYIKTKRVWSN